MEGNVDYFTMVYYLMNVVICIYTHLHVSFVLFCIVRYIYVVSVLLTTGVIMS